MRAAAVRSGTSPILRHTKGRMAATIYIKPYFDFEKDAHYENQSKSERF
jgi:hypothetical protein